LGINHANDVLQELGAEGITRPLMGMHLLVTLRGGCIVLPLNFSRALHIERH
jgi:hypothetical protein